MFLFPLAFVTCSVRVLATCGPAPLRVHTREITNIGCSIYCQTSEPERPVYRGAFTNKEKTLYTGAVIQVLGGPGQMLALLREDGTIVVFKGAKQISKLNAVDPSLVCWYRS